MDLVSFFEKKLRRKGVFLLLLLFAIFGPSCSSPRRRPVLGVGFGDVYREIRWSGGTLESPALHVGPLAVPLAGPAFELEFQGLGRLGPADFDGKGIEGLGTTRVQARFAGKRVPLEVVLHYRARLEDPSFEKTLQVRWLGLPSRAPLLQRVLVQSLPWEGGRPPRAGRPCVKPGLCAALAVPWGGAREERGRLFLEEYPRVSLQGGWWRSAPAVLCPSGAFPPELAFLRWTAHERGGRERLLLYRGVEGEGPLPATPPGFVFVPLRPAEGEALARRFSPRRPGKEKRKGKKKPAPEGLLLFFPPGTRAESPLFRKALQVALGLGKGLPALVLQGVDSRGDPRALGDALSLFRAFSREGKFLLGWDRKGPISPFWQAFADGQDGLDPKKDGPLLGQALASLEPWRSRGEEWNREAAERLLWNLARGVCALDLGWIPPRGTEARRYLEEALAWAGREKELIRNVHTPFQGEPGFRASGENWVAVQGGRLLWARRGKAGGKESLALDGKWRWVVEIYPERKILRAPGRKEEAPPSGEGFFLLEAWLKGKEPPSWVRSWASGGSPPGKAPLPPRGGLGTVSLPGVSGPLAGRPCRRPCPGSAP